MLQFQYSNVVNNYEHSWLWCLTTYSNGSNVASLKQPSNLIITKMRKLCTWFQFWVNTEQQLFV